MSDEALRRRLEQAWVDCEPTWDAATAAEHFLSYLSAVSCHECGGSGRPNFTPDPFGLPQIITGRRCATCGGAGAASVDGPEER